MSKDMLGEFAKAYMFADMLTPAKQPQVIHEGYSDADLTNAENAVVGKANKIIRQQNATIRALKAENARLQKTMAVAREGFLEQIAIQREKDEYTMELEIQIDMMAAELAQKEAENSSIKVIEHRADTAMTFDLEKDRETVSKPSRMKF